jgi:hypothetical protein
MPDKRKARHFFLVLPLTDGVPTDGVPTDGVPTAEPPAAAAAERLPDVVDLSCFGDSFGFVPVCPVSLLLVTERV